MTTIQNNTFAAACYDQNSYAELEAMLRGPADVDDCRTWRISVVEWRAQVELALSHKRKPGRPVGSGQGRTARIEWRTTLERKACAESMAQAEGLTLSAWLDKRIDSAR